jgi:hypothetical protein
MAQRSHGASRTRSGDLLGAIQAVVGVDRPVMLTPPPTMPAETPTPRRLLFGLAPTRSRVDVLLTPPPAMPAETSPRRFPLRARLDRSRVDPSCSHRRLRCARTRPRRR